MASAQHLFHSAVCDTTRFIAVKEELLPVIERWHTIRCLTLFFGLAVFGVLLRVSANGQVVPAFRGGGISPQLAGTLQYTVADYALASTTNHLTRVRLTGGAVEYSDVRFGAVGLVGRTSYGASNILGQRLLASEGGIVYSRRVKQFAPFGEVMAGLARTSSSEYQYLYTSSKIGFVATASGGVDFHARGRWGLRLLQIGTDHYSFGVNGARSAYWTFGAGVFYSFGSH